MNSLVKQSAIVIRPPSGSKRLPDNNLWTNRFEIRSASSNRVYIVAQNKATGKMGCSCPSYLTRRYCKHLTQGCGLLMNQIHGHGQITGRKSE